MKKIPTYPVFATLLCLLACSCVSPDQKRFIESARTITEFPVKREHLISVLDLECNSSWRSSDIICYGLNFRETWRHESGLTVTATDSDPAGLDYGDEFEKMISPMQGNQKTAPRRNSFDYFVVANDERVLYQSWDREKAKLSTHTRPESKSKNGEKPRHEMEEQSSQRVTGQIFR